MDKILHLSRYYPVSGGMGEILNQHAEAGHNVLGFMTDSDCMNPSLIKLPEFGLWTSLRKIRSSIKLKLKRENLSFDCTLFYNGYGMEWIENDDRLGFKVLYLHSDYPQLSKWVTRKLRYLDAIFVVNQSLKKKLRKEVPFLPESRIHVINLPVNIPVSVIRERTVRRKKIIIGFSGRIQFRQKRLDRLVALKTELDKAGIKYQVEFLGDGPARKELEEYFSEDKRWIFHGTQKGEVYWRILKQWKYLLFLSDYEGLPISLLEGLAAGVVPLYPKLFDAADLVEKIDPVLSYEFGEVKFIPPIIQRVESWNDEKWANFYERSNELLLPHLDGDYVEKMSFLVKKIPVFSKRERYYPSSYPGYYPLWIYNRIQHKLKFDTFRPPRFSITKGYF